MGREVRRVPGDWIHPVDERGNLIPLLPGSFQEARKEYERQKRLFSEGKRERYDGEIVNLSEEDISNGFKEWHGPPPDVDRYMPDWRDDEKTHIMMYEDTTEGTPISPAFETPEDLASWLADNNASAWGDEGASYEQWLGMIKRGYAPSMVFDSRDGTLMSGVEFVARQEKRLID